MGTWWEPEWCLERATATRWPSLNPLVVGVASAWMSRIWVPGGAWRESYDNRVAFFVLVDGDLEIQLDDGCRIVVLGSDEFLENQRYVYLKYIVKLQVLAV